MDSLRPHCPLPSSLLCKAAPQFPARIAFLCSSRPPGWHAAFFCEMKGLLHHRAFTQRCVQSRYRPLPTSAQINEGQSHCNLSPRDLFPGSDGRFDSALLSNALPSALTPLCAHISILPPAQLSSAPTQQPHGRRETTAPPGGPRGAELHESPFGAPKPTPTFAAPPVLSQLEGVVAVAGRAAQRGHTVVLAAQRRAVGQLLCKERQRGQTDRAELSRFCPMGPLPSWNGSVPGSYLLAEAPQHPRK